MFGSFSGSVGYYFVMFFIMALVMTLIEYLVGLLSIHVMGIRLWDYSHCWGNIQGIICPLFTMPYSGTQGPNRKPGFSHLCSGFEPEKNLRNTSSSTQPAHAPKKNKNTMSRKI